MLRVTLKNFWAHKRRMIGTMLAILFGIAFLSGTYVLGDTMRNSFGELFSQVSKGTDAKIRSANKFEAQGTTIRGEIPASILGEVRKVPGVAVAEPDISGYGQIVGADGKTLGGNGPPTIGGNWTLDEELNPYHLVEGRAPRTNDEVVIDKKSADDGKLKVGSRTEVLTPEPVEVTVVGIAKFGSIDNAGGSTFAGFTLAGAQEHVLKKTGVYSSISVRAEPGVSQEELVKRIKEVVPKKEVQVLTGKAYAKDQTDDIGKAFLDFFTTFLKIFGFISLAVATFSIYNTFSIIVAQRTRESALLRAIGAARGQILGSVLVETVTVGIIASLLGFGVGIGIASLLQKVLGFGTLPGGLVVKPWSFIVAMVVGIGVTLIAGMFPSVRASRVPPIAALRAVALDRSDTSRPRAVIGVVLMALGLAVSLAAGFATFDGRVWWVAGGALALLVGIIVFGPVAAKPTSRLLGAPAARFRGVAGNLARENAMRNPARTSGTSAALMVGVVVVALFTVFASSVKESINKTVDQQFGGDLVVGPNQTFGPAPSLSPKIVKDLDALPQVAASVGLGNGFVRLDGKDRIVGVSDPAALDKVIDLQVKQGSLQDLKRGDLAVSKKRADAKDWKIGTKLKVKYPDGTRETLRIGAIYGRNQLAGNYLLPQATWAPHATQESVSAILVDLRSGVSLDAGRKAVEKVSDAYPGTKVQDRQQFADSVGQGIDTLLNFIYVMLALAVIIALMGIANTLSLSVYERTRELGLLRAVGQTRRQMRSMVRWESVIVSVFGTIGGLALGTFVGWAVVKATADQGIVTFAIPTGRYIVILVVGAIVGVLAAIRPARRAAKLNILDAVGAD